MTTTINQSTTPMAEWISVKEHLPEQHQDWENYKVWCFTPNEGGLQTAVVFNNGEFLIWEYDIPYCREEGFAPLTGVTHWMPLPEPPKPDSND